MTIPTCAVVCRALANGSPLAGVPISATLSRYEVHDGYVVPQRVDAVTDADGEAVLHLWPNELGVTGSWYIVEIAPPGAPVLRTRAVVPNVATVQLHTVANLPAYPGKPDGELAIEEAVRASGEATLARADAVRAASESAVSADVAGQAVTAAADYADAASSAAGRADAAAGRADASEQAAQQHESASAGSASAAATAAGTASTKADEASASAGQAATSAGAAAASAQQADVSASQAVQAAASAINGPLAEAVVRATGMFGHSYHQSVMALTNNSNSGYVPLMSIGV